MFKPKEKTGMLPKISESQLQGHGRNLMQSIYLHRLELEGRQKREEVIYYIRGRIFSW